MLKNVEIVAVCDSSEKAVKDFSRRHNIPKAYTEISQMFEKENLDFIDICTPPSTHYPICSSAIDHGLHVIVEKPIAITVEDTLKLRDQSKRKNVKVCPIHNTRFRDNVSKAVQMVNEGRVGRIRKVTSVVHSPGPYPDWFWNEEENGGILYESAIHLIDLQTVLCGEHQKVIGLYRNFDEGLNLTTDVSALVEYKSGALGTIDVSAFSPSIYAHFDIFGTGTNINLKFNPNYYSTSLGPYTPLAELKSENKRFFGYAKAFLFGLKSYKRAYHFVVLSEFIKSIELDIDPPITIDSVVPTMRLIEDLRRKRCTSELINVSALA
jgi:UDP-N-acetyl-2-amino-2-deoxyglucuronate dehydrogenase